MQWKVPIDDSDGEKFTCQRVREQRTKRKARCLHNRRKRAALKKELIANTPFAEEAKARSRSSHGVISKYITGTDRRSTVLKLVASLQRVVCSEVPLFSRILTPRGAQTSLIY
jgi:hypothetical protein